MFDFNMLTYFILIFGVTASEKCLNNCEKSGPLLFSEVINQPPKENIQNFTITFNTPDNQKISCINITRLKFSNTWCEIFEGGIGQNFTKIHLFSSGHGIRYKIDIFGSEVFETEIYQEDYNIAPLVAIYLIFVIILVFLIKIFVHNLRSVNNFFQDDLSEVSFRK